MRNWVLGIMFGILGLCATRGLLGYFVGVPKVQEALSESRDEIAMAMGQSLSSSIDVAIVEGALENDTLVLWEYDVDVNNSAGYDRPNGRSGPGGATYSGFATLIAPAGITLVMDEEWSSTGVPVVVSGTIDLTEITVETPTKLTNWVLDAAGFEKAFELGLNDALADQGLIPVSLTLGEGWMTIVVKPASPAGTPAATTLRPSSRNAPRGS